jgi:hypothetical protein
MSQGGLDVRLSSLRSMQIILQAATDENNNMHPEFHLTRIAHPRRGRAPQRRRILWRALSRNPAVQKRMPVNTQHASAHEIL